MAQEGRSRKFNKQVDQVTFSGEFAAEQDRAVLYVTERCVFALSGQAVKLTEVAPGIDIERDILAQMDFEPIIDKPAMMDAGIFRDQPMNLLDSVMRLDHKDRISYDAKRHILFLSFEGLHVQSTENIEEIRTAVEARCKKVRRKVDVVVNYDRFKIDDELVERYADMVRYMEETHYRQVSRYTTSVFMRLMLGKALAREVAPHIFETHEGARAFLRHTGS